MNLNSEQLSAVMCEDKKILCLAGAGTGKTSCMLERISHLVEKGVNPSSILVLTFTNAAAFEMKDRYQRSHETRFIPEFRTFHSFCYHVLSIDGEVRKILGYTSLPSIADEGIRKRIIREAGTISNIKTSIEALEVKEKRTAKEQYEYETLKKLSSKLMQKRNTITFDHLCSSICNLFKEEHPAVKKYKERYKYIFVDEFQDTDQIQYNFVKSFTDSNLFLVGDALQALYSFRGADSSIIKSLSENPEWHTIKLFRNYRSTETICKFANEHSKYADDNYRVEIQPGRDEIGEKVLVVDVTEFTPYGQIDKKSVDTCIKESVKMPGSTAILCRTNREVEELQEKFTEAGIQFRTNNQQKDTENILLSVGDNDHLLSWLSSFLNAERYADFIRVSTVVEGSGESYNITSFLNDFGNIPQIESRWGIVKTIRRICKESTVSIFDRFTDIVDLLSCSYIPFDESKCFNMKSTIFYILDVFSGCLEQPGSNIYIGTIHSVKGLEYDNVYVVGVDGPTFQLNNEDNKNLYYVAITRAKKHLTVFERKNTF